MLLKFFRYAKGYVTFTASGKFPERFLNAAAVNKLNLWDAYPSKGKITATMAAADYKRARHIAQRAGLKLKITSKRGVPFFVKRHSSRLGLPIGALLGAVLLVVLSQFIWTVDITGAKTVSDNRIRESLADNGVYPGAFKWTIDVLDSQRAVQMDIDELSWVSINNLGCKSTADVREKAKKTDEPKSQSPCNIKADCDGVITKIIAENGFSAVEEGSGVKQGDLLVSGVLPTGQDTIRFVRAEAEVYADVNSKFELKIPKEYDYYSVNENKTDRNKLNFLWLSIPASLNFTAYPQSVSSQNRVNLSVNGNALPLGITTQTSYDLRNISVKENSEKAQQAFEKTLLLYEVFENPSASVKSREITLTEDETSFNFTCDYTFNRNIAQSVEFDVTEH